MTLLMQLAPDIGIDPKLQCDTTTTVHLDSGWLRRAHMSKTGSVSGRLDVHAKVDDIAKDLHLSLGLHRAAHNPETKPRVTVPRDKRGDDGMKRPLVGLEPVGMFLIQRKERTSVLQHKTKIIGNKA